MVPSDAALYLPALNRRLDNHLAAPLPTTGTLIRVVGVWCDDV